MNVSREQKCWATSIAVHALVLLLLSLSIPNSLQPSQDPMVPIEVTIIEKKVQAPVKSKQLIAKKAQPQAIKKPAPTSLPGDRLQPAIAQQTSPVYPKTALNNDWEGRVKVRVTVSPSGKPIATKVIVSSGHAILDQSFVRTIMQSYHFNPQRKMGKNMTGTIVVSHTFSLGATL